MGNGGSIAQYIGLICEYHCLTYLTTGRFFTGAATVGIRP
jgi:hypothetical protein